MRGRQPRAEWSEQRLRAFQDRLRAWMAERDLDAWALGELLGYRSNGLLVRMYLGDLETTRVPSAPFLERLKEAGFSGNGAGDEPIFPTELHPVVSGVVAVTSLTPGTVILGQPRQCPECLAEAEEGERHPARTWYIFAHPRQRYCSVEHRRAWYRRQRKRARDA
jgi:hypothetical protein